MSTYLISNLPQEIFPPLFVIISLDTFWRKAVNNTHYPTALPCFSNYYLNRVCCCTEDAAYLLTILYCIQDVYRKGVPDYNYEKMPGRYIGCVFNCLVF